MENNINEALTPFEELSKLLGNIHTQLETISGKFDDMAEAMKPIKAISNEMSKIQLSDILGIGGFLVDMTGLIFNFAQITLTISNSVEDIIDKLSNGSESVKKISKQLGHDIGKGISEGLKDSIATVKMATSVICDKGIIAEFKSEMEINSPSKAMKRIASSIPEGIVDGIKDGQAGIKKDVHGCTSFFIY